MHASGEAENDAVQVSDSEVLIDLHAIPALCDVPGFVAVPSAKIVVVRSSDVEFRAFSTACSHAGCSVDTPFDRRVICPVHASEYDLGGVPIAGPASLPLHRFTVEFLRELGVVRINRRRLVPNGTLVERINGRKWSSAPPIAPALSASEVAHGQA